jgi:hypothetical protein
VLRRDPDETWGVAKLLTELRCQPAATEMMNAEVLPVSRGDSNAWVRVASHLVPARVNLATSSERCRPSVKVGHGLID